MAAERQRQVEAIFRDALGVGPGERSAWLSARCGGDEGLRGEVLELLGFHEEEGEGPLDQSPVVVGSGPGAGGAGAGGLAPGVRLGRYQVERLLGEGGMGVVYVARQERPRRTVALKLIRPGFATPGVLRRFEHEAEVLGRLHHPGIAQIYEAGMADTGLGPQPFFAMELVDGPPLLEFASGRGVRERVGLLVKVCRAVEHAHQRGVIHRDLKPANILVDGAGEPKVLDFGVARAAEAEAGGPTHANTRAGQLVGTLPYMSPEQVAGDVSDLDTRSDVYALGVILYQVLGGVLPHGLEGLTLGEAVRVIREVPAAPLWRHGAGLRGDLSTIAARAMAKERQRRYQSAAELADELERYLSGRPIEARRDSAVYVLGRHLRRRWPLASAVAAGLLVLVVFAVVSARQAEANRGLAESNGQLAQQMTMARDKIARALDETRSAREREAVELTNSNLARARLLADRGDTEESLRLFWGEYLRRPDRALTRLALWGFYAAYPIAAVESSLRVETPVAAAFPDGRRVVIPASAEAGRAALQIYDAGLLATRAVMPAGSARVTDAVISPDGSLVAIGNYAGEVLLYDGEGREVVTGAKISIGQYAMGMSISPDNRTLVVSGLQRTLAAFDVPSGARVGFLDMTASAGNPVVGSTAFSPEGRLFAASWNGRVDELDPRTLATVRSVAVVNERLDTLSFSPDGRTLAANTYYGDLVLVDPATLKVTRRWRVGRSATRGVQFLDGGETLLTCGSTMALWNAGTGSPIRTLGSNADVFCAAAYLAGVKRFVSLGSTGAMRVLDRDPAGMVRGIALGHSSLATASFSADGRLACVTPTADRLALVESASGRVLALAPEAIPGASETVFGPRGEVYIATGIAELVSWELGTGELRTGPVLGKDPAFSLAISADGSRLAVGDRGGVVHVLDVPTRTVLRSIVVGDEAVHSLRFTPDGRLFAVPSEVVEVDTERGTVKPGPVAGKGHRAVAISRGGKLLGALGPRGVYLAELRGASGASGAGGERGEPRYFPAGASAVASCEFSPDGATLVMGYQDGTVRGWDVQTGNLSVMFQDLQDRVAGLVFSPDGRYLMETGGSGRSALRDLWALDEHLRHSAAWARGLLIAQPASAEKAAATAGLDALRDTGAGRMFWGGPPAGRPVAAGPDPAGVAAWGAATLEHHD